MAPLNLYARFTIASKSRFVAFNTGCGSWSWTHLRGSGMFVGVVDGCWSLELLLDFGMEV